MRPPLFWYQNPGPTSNLLRPLAAAFKGATALRRVFAKPYHAKVPVICVGNIVVGGSGKTPTALTVVDLLKRQGHRPAFVTRGYGGYHKGPLRVDLQSHVARDVGDEALLLAREAPTWIGQNRVAAIQNAEKESTIIILDDGLQNPFVAPSLNLLVVDSARAFGNELLLPAGPLRETLLSVQKRLHGVVIIGEDTKLISSRFHIPVFRARFAPILPSDFPLSKKFLAFAGIGFPTKFYDTCHAAGLSIELTHDYPDHHFYSQRELRALEKKASQGGLGLLTTEKDWVRLPKEWRLKIHYLPVTLVFDEEKALIKFLTS